MNQDDFKRRTRALALAAIKLTDALPRDRVTDVIAGQLVRSATSVGANYRAACRYRSTADMVAKLGVVLEEADETSYWLELLRDTGKSAGPELEELAREADEITAMTVASIKTLRSRLRNKP